MIKLFLICFLFSGFLIGQEQDYHKYGIDTTKSLAPKGLQIGEKAPEFSGIDQDGNIINLSSILTKKPVVLIFYRGQWCPVCMRYLKSFQDSLKLIENKGVAVI